MLSKAQSCIVPIQPRGWLPPFIWIELSSSVMALARALGSERPVLAVSVEDLDRGEHFVGYARQVAALICSEYPSDEYSVGGLCTAGTLAYEVAVQLRAAGKAVSLIVLLNAVNPGSLPTALSRIQAMRERLFFHLWQAVRHGEGDRLGYIRAKINGLARRLKILAPAPPFWPANSIRAHIERVAFDYSAPMLDVDVLCLQPKERSRSENRPATWKEVVRGSLTVYDVSASHITMMQRPYVDALAQRVRNHLLLAEARERSRREDVRPRSGTARSSRLTSAFPLTVGGTRY